MAPPSNTPSSNIADYELGDILGVGTVGTVYACVEKYTGESYALKKLHSIASGDPLIRARFKREISVMQRLDHPFVVTCYGGGESADGSLYYVMERVDGGTVKDLLQHQPRMPWPAVVHLGRQISSVLQCAHNNGVVHRDLKPSNLFLNRDADLRLGDFGIARDLHNSDLSTTGMTVGTHGYMAPEQITGDDLVSGKADLYSLGCCLFEMLTGRPPFTAETPPQLFELHLRSEPPRVKSIVADCPEALDEVVDALLAKKPEDRPFNARQVQAAMIELGERKLSAAVGSKTISGEIGLPVHGESPNQAETDQAKTDHTKTDHTKTQGTDGARDGQTGAGQQARQKPVSGTLGSEKHSTEISAAEYGHEILVRQITQLGRGAAAVNVSWGRLAVMAVAIVLAVVVAFLSQK